MLRWDDLANVIDVIPKRGLGQLIRNNALRDMIVDLKADIRVIDWFERE